MALQAYRHLLRSSRIAFQGDIPLLTASRAEIRSNFRKNINLQPADPTVPGLIKHAEEVAKILVENVVQGKKIGEESEEKYKLRIHEKTERGDNDTIKMPNGQTVVIDGKTCCSDK
ncbi:mitochondrial zinc maintenance protein 1, mitochondrial [Halenospora varia]|nr:mitochondrial zinc maintenance protein 1, mitochondrial [Halenospora varia]